MQITVTVNALRHDVEIDPGETLLELLRRLGYKGVKKGCGTGDCGACAVLLDGRAINSCLCLAAKLSLAVNFALRRYDKWAERITTFIRNAGLRYHGKGDASPGSVRLLGILREAGVPLRFIGSAAASIM